MAAVTFVAGLSPAFLTLRKSVADVVPGEIGIGFVIDPQTTLCTVGLAEPVIGTYTLWFAEILL